MVPYRVVLHSMSWSLRHVQSVSHCHVDVSPWTLEARPRLTLKHLFSSTLRTKSSRFTYIHLPSPPISPISHVQLRHPRHLPPPPHRPIRPVPTRPQARRDILCPSPPRALRGAQLQFQRPTFEEETML